MVGILLGFLGPHRAAFVAKSGHRRNSLPHPEGRSEVEDGKGRLSWSAATARNGQVGAPSDLSIGVIGQGKKVGSRHCGRRRRCQIGPRSKARIGVVRPQGETGHGRHKANCGTGSSGRTSWGETEVRACGLTPLSRHAVLLLVNAQPSRSSGLGRYLRPQQRRHSKYCEPAKGTRRQCMHRKPRRCNGGVLRHRAE